MGVIEHDQYCHTCNQNNIFCPGHFGHINLPRPVYYIQFLPVIFKVLKCVCWRCSALLVNKDENEIKSLLTKKTSGMKRFDTIYKLSNKLKCYSCGVNGTRQPDNFTKDNNVVKIFGEFKNTDSNEKSLKKFFPVEEVERIFRNITDEDCEILGFSKLWSRPEWMICSVFPVPPPCVRPSVKNDSGQRSEDDLTHKLSDIIKSCNALKDKIDSNAPADKIEDWTQVLQLHIITFVDNENSKFKPAIHRSGRPLKSVTQRLKSKEGRIRGNLMGKRVDFSARSVITPDPNISIDQLGVPLQIAMNLTFPEVVNDYNKNKLTVLLKNGPGVYPGAKLLRQISNNNRVIRLKSQDRNSIILQNGDILERHLLDDDIVLFNRQPSLHKMSMMAHKIKIVIPPEGVSYSTFRLNVSVTKPYNADFDGDEMNMHVPQSLQTRMELKELASVQYQIISPRIIKPVISIVQDTLLGVFKITNSNVFVNRNRMMNLMMWNSLFDGQLPIAEVQQPFMRWTGRQILSSIIPDGINIKMSNGLLDGFLDDEKNIVIVDGDLKHGIIDEFIYSSQTKGLIHSIYNDYGPIICKNFLDDTQNIITNWLTGTSHSVGISDLIADSFIKDKFHNLVSDMKIEVDKIMQSLHLNIFKNSKAKTNNEAFEEEVNKKLNEVLNKSGKLALNSLDKYNRMTNMVNSGSKGKASNVSQILALLGQQNVEGKRISYGFTDRTLPHYTKYDDGPESRGFVENCFMDGLSPQEFFFHAMGGREGVIDTAIKTAETGYLQRKLVKAMEDYKVYTDFTVRNATGNIIQFLYGEDGIESVKLERQNVRTLDMSDEHINAEYKFDVYETFETFMEEDAIKEMKREAHWDELLYDHSQEIISDRDFIINSVFIGGRDLDIYNPVPMMRIMNKAITLYHVNDNNETRSKRLSDINPLYILDTLDNLEKELKINDYNKGNKLLMIVLKTYLSPKIIIKEKRLSKLAFDYIIVNIKNKYFEGIVSPGEMVGPVAAQSIGEPATQMSNIFETIIRCKSKNNYYNIKIGELIDKILDENEDDIIYLGNQSVALDMDKHDYYICGVSEDEKVSWKKISEISRHLPHGNLVKVTTRSNRTTTATLSHSFLKRTLDKIVPIKGSQLKKGDRIPIAKNIPTIDNPLNLYKGFLLDKEFGWIIGAYLADGCINETTVSISKVNMVFEKNIKKFCEIMKYKFRTYLKYSENIGDYDKGYSSKDNVICSKEFSIFIKDNFDTGSSDKKIPGWVFFSNKDFIGGLLGGFMDGDGNVHANKQNIRCHSINEPMLNDIAVLFSYFGIFAVKLIQTKNEENHKKQSAPNEIPKVLHELNISRKYAKILRDEIGLLNEFKIDELNKIIEYNDREDKHDVGEYIDKIPELGDTIADIGKMLELPGQSRNYGRWRKKEAIGRRTLQKYIEIFEEENKVQKNMEVNLKIEILKQAAYSDVIWDEIIELEIIVPDQNEYVYDFTVPGNDTFMVDCGILVHNTLNTFHSAGISSKSNVTRGVPRMKELLSVTKNIKTPYLTIYPKEDIIENLEKVKNLKNKLEKTTLREIVTNSRIYYDPDDITTNIEDDINFINIYNEFNDIYTQCKESEDSPWLLRFEFDKEIMMDKEISMQDVHHSIYNEDDDVKCMFSDDNASKLIFRLRLKDKLSDDEVYTLKVKEKELLDRVVIKGFNKINNVEIIPKKRKVYGTVGDSKDDKYKMKTEMVLYTTGTNLDEILNHPEVDSFRTTTSDVIEIYEILGVEAARYALYQELKELLDSAGTSVNYRHISLLIDTMTNKGTMMSIDRHGINRGDIGPLAKSSFEETTDILIKASMFGEYDKINGVSANIMLGQLPPCGTGDADILFDIETFKKNKIDVKYDSLDYEKIDAEVEDELNKPFDCEENNFDFSIGLNDKIKPTLNLDINKIKVNVK
jgi:DNA-directed RNA polymerase beta' subunit